jgi:exodeoxyribonuclease-3
VLLVSWNVNSLRARMPRVLELLAEHRPDVACLQETKCAPDGFPADELRAAGYDSVHHSAGRWAGVALLARDRLGLQAPRLGLDGEPDPGAARWCEATIAGIRIASAYVPNGRAISHPEYERKLAFLDAMRMRVAALAGRGGAPLIVAGDLNVAPADEDVYDPQAFIGSTHVSPPERERLEAILEAGMVDCYRALHPDERQFTWWDYRQGHFHRGLGMRIDLVLASTALAGRLERCGIERDYRKGPKPSDHAPLLTQFA